MENELRQLRQVSVLDIEADKNDSTNGEPNLTLTLINIKIQESKPASLQALLTLASPSASSVWPAAGL